MGLFVLPHGVNKDWALRITGRHKISLQPGLSFDTLDRMPPLLFPDPHPQFHMLLHRYM